MRLPFWFVKFYLALMLALGPLGLRAQEVPAPALYSDAGTRYRLMYSPTWQVRNNVGGVEATFSAPSTGRPVPAVVTLTMQLLPDDQKDLKLLSSGGLDSARRRALRLPQPRIIRLDQLDNGRYEEVRYDYTYASAPARTHVVGRQIWRSGYEFRVEYRAETAQDARYLAEGLLLVDSFVFTDNPLPSRRYADQLCDDKMYGIAAMRIHDGQWEDDCRTIHQFSSSDLTARPVVHRLALPFQSYALAKGFDNCLYSVTKAPTDAPELVYRYDPAKRQGAYTTWRLPAQGPDNVWISAATDEQGDLYFLTSDANKLVKISPGTGVVTALWTTDPLRKAPFYRAIAFPGAGTHGNFCLDDANTMYLVYSTDGSLLKVDLTTRQPQPDLMPLDGLPRLGGYSDLLMQNDEAGRRRLYLAGPKALYKVDLAKHQASLVRKGTYTDLAGCNLFRVVRRVMTAPPPAASVALTGRVLSAATYQPLPQAHFRLGVAGAEKPVLLTPQGTFTVAVRTGRAYSYHAQLAGYFATDSITTVAQGASVQDILLRPLTVGTTLRLHNVQFEQGQAVLLASSYPALDQLAGQMREAPGLTIELRGHTDNVGPPEKNVVLSEQRVAAVKAYLVGRGIAAARITGVGLGGAEPMASNEQEATRQLNRRVEFRVTGMQ